MNDPRTIKLKTTRRNTNWWHNARYSAISDIDKFITWHLTRRDLGRGETENTVPHLDATWPPWLHSTATLFKGRAGSSWWCKWWHGVTDELTKSDDDGVTLHAPCVSPTVTQLLPRITTRYGLPGQSSLMIIYIKLVHSCLPILLFPS